MDKTKDGFNKLQWSKFVGKEEQYVVRCNDMGEFIQLIAEINEFLLAKQPKEEVPPFAQPEVKAEVKKTWSGGFKKQQAGEICNKCHKAEIVLNPNSGKTFCKDKCWLKMGEV